MLLEEGEERVEERHAALVEHALFDDPVRLPEDRRWDRQPERLRGLEIDDELKFRGLLHREIGGLRTLENLDVISTLASCPA